MYKYSEELIEETIEIFIKEDDLEFSKNKAIESLNNLSRLFISFIREIET